MSKAHQKTNDSRLGRTVLFAAISNAKGDVLNEIQLFKIGEFVHWSGTEFKVDDDFMDKMISNFNAMKEISKDPNHVIAIDYDHGSTDMFSTNGKASGWIHELYKKDDGLYCKVRWTQAAADMIKAGEYVYISPTFSLDDVDEHGDPYDGPVLWAAALTNVPFLKGMAPAVAAKNQPKPGGSQMNKRLIKLFGLPDTADEGAIEAAVRADRSVVTKLSKALELPNEGADPLDIIEAVNVLKTEHSDALEAAKTAKAELAKIEKAAIDEKVKTTIEAAIEKGQILPAMKKDWLERCSKDVSLLELVEKLPKAVDLSRHGSGGENAEATDAVESFHKATLERAAKDGVSYVEAQKRLRKDNPELAKQYVESSRAGRAN